LTVLEIYLLLVERFGNLIQVLLIPNSKLSVTMHIYGEKFIYLFEQPNL